MNGRMEPRRPKADGHSRAALRVWLRMLGCTREIEKRLQAKLASEFDSTLPRFDVLAALDRHPEGLTMSALAATLRVSNGNTTGVVRRLEEDGYISRTAMAHDRRLALVKLTQAGRTAFAVMAQAHAGWIETIFHALAPAELDALAARLQEIRAGLAVSPESDQPDGDAREQA